VGRQARKPRGSAAFIAAFSPGVGRISLVEESTWRRRLEDKVTTEPLMCLHNPRTEEERQWISEINGKLRVQDDAAAKRPAVGALNHESAVGGLALRLAQPELARLVSREKPEAE